MRRGRRKVKLAVFIDGVDVGVNPEGSWTVVDHLQEHHYEYTEGVKHE